MFHDIVDKSTVVNHNVGVALQNLAALLVALVSAWSRSRGPTPDRSGRSRSSRLNRRGHRVPARTGRRPCSIQR
jgi:hypothetical protein